LSLYLFYRLTQEWTSVGSSAAGVAALRRWAAEDPDLAGLENLDDLIRSVHRRGRARESDLLLAALARRAPDDKLAARTLLQAVLPGLVRIAVSIQAPKEDEDVASLVLARAYERIRHYPIDRRPEHIAANIVLDTRQKVSRELSRSRVHEVLVEEVAMTDVASDPSDSGVEALALIEAAVRRKELLHHDAQLIVLTRLHDVPLSRLAAEWGFEEQTLRARRRRAEAHLAATIA
jgi:hypothetical protein